MPRTPRLDHPGAIHHVIARGIARTPLFVDDGDRRRLLAICDRVFGECGTRALAWALMSNHIHWLVETGPVPLSRVFQRVLGAYASGFNRRHDRPGHLFQDRFVSLLVDSDEYLVTLVGYVLLNPVRAGTVPTVGDLEAYPWTAYRAISGAAPLPFEDVDRVLTLFGDTPESARARLGAFLVGLRAADGAGPEPLPGWLPVSRRTQFECEVFGVAGRLCRTAELGRAVREIDALDARAAALRRLGWTVQRIVGVVASRVGVDAREIRSGSQRRAACRARAIVALLACRYFGASQAHVARETGVIQSAVSHALRKAEAYATAASIDPSDVLRLDGAGARRGAS